VLKEAGLHKFWRDGDQRTDRTRVMFQADWNMDVEEGLDGVGCRLTLFTIIQLPSPHLIQHYTHLSSDMAPQNNSVTKHFNLNLCSNT
jgi:hypothetical protein